MKLNRSQLRKLIIKETRLITESPADAGAVSAAIAAGGAASGMPAAAAMIVALVTGKALAGTAEAMYDALDDKVKIALDGLVAAIQAVPENMKDSLIEAVVELINDATASIS